jgi:hypothetical protein
MDPITSSGLPFIKFALAFLAFLILPGYLIWRLFFNVRAHKIVEIVPLSFSFSVAFISTLGMILYFADSDVTTLLNVLYISIPILIVLNVLVWRRNKYKYLAELNMAAPSTYEAECIGRPLSIAIVTLLFFAFGLMLYRGAVISWSTDILDHIGTIREIVEKRQIFPGNSFYAGEDGLGADPRKGLYHVSVAILAIVTNIEPYKVWIYLPALLLPIMLCSYFAFAREMFQNNKIAFIALILLFLCYGGINTEFKRAVGYPSRVAFQIYLTALFLAFRYLRIQNIKYLIASAFLGYAIATVHVYYYFQFLLALFAFFVFMVLFRREFKNVIWSTMKLGILTLLISLPIIYLRYTLSYSTDNPYDSALRHVVFFAENIYIVTPSQPWDRIGLAGLIAFLAVPFLYKYTRKHYWACFLFATMVIIPLIIFNPIVVPSLGEFLTIGLVRRIIRLAPYIAVIAFFMYTTINALFGEQKKAVKIKAIGVLALFLLMLLPYFGTFYRQYKPSALSREKSRSAFNWIEALDYMENNISDSSVIVSDPMTSYSIPAFTRHYIIAVPIGHSSPKDALNVQKVRDAMKILNPYIDMSSTVRLLNQYNVDYVILNEKFEHPIYQYGWSLNPRLYDLTRNKFEKHPAIFRKIYEEQDVRIYEYRAPNNYAGLAGEAITNRPFISQETPWFRKTINETFDDQFLLLGAKIDTDAIGRGEILGIKCYWKNTQNDAPSRSYKIYVRFDTDYIKNKLYNERWSKPYRRITQLFKGERYRFRTDHNPVNNLYPPSFWKKNEIVVDEFQVKIPSDVSPGRYDVKIKMLEMPFSPNYRFMDFLSDDDSYNGVTVGTIEIRE